MPADGNLDYARNLVRRAFDKAGATTLSRSEITKYIQSRVSTEDRQSTFKAMTEDGELAARIVDTRGRVRVDYDRLRVVEASNTAPKQAGERYRDSSARQRKNALARALAELTKEANAALRENTAAMVDLTDALRAVAR